MTGVVCPLFVTRLLDDGQALLEPVQLQFMVRDGRKRLIGLQADDTFSLRLTNQFNQSRILHFTPTRRLFSPELSNRMGRCHFEAMNDESGEHSALNICRDSDLSGLIRLDGKQFDIFSISDRFFLSPRHQGSDCSWPSGRARRGVDWPSGRARGGVDWPNGRVNRGVDWPSGRARRGVDVAVPSIPQIPDYYASYLDGKRRFVELALIADHSMFVRFDSNEQKVQERLASVTNIVNSIYQPLNIRITLVWVRVWTNGDMIPVSADADLTLNGFLAHRRTLIKDHPHDNAHLITNISFANNVVGKAFKGTMCSWDYSGGVDVDHGTHPGALAGTLAHELGHNFGMEHDVDDLCQCAAPSHNNCVMAPSSSGHSMFWSDCSLKVLEQNFQRGVDVCLKNSPDVAFGGAKCGNGVVEPGEECDCGPKDYCSNKCCDWETCRLAKEAECASGDCCDTKTCKPRAAATVCRQTSGQCDLPEYCDGNSENCPADFYVQDGVQCPNDAQGYCFNGQCGGRDSQCRLVWGSSGRKSDLNCYKANEQGNQHGNCGYDPVSNLYSPCAPQDAACGRLHCEHDSERTEFGHSSIVYSAQSFIRRSDGSVGSCSVVRITFTGDNKKQRDPGMVADGTSCGKDRICVNSKCSNQTETLKMVSKCSPTDCHKLGICNSAGNCHCIVGYGGTDCAIPGPGGSVNSGPASTNGVFNAALVLFWILLVVVLLFVAVSFYFKKKRNFWLHQKMWARMRSQLKLYGVFVPVRSAPPPPRGARQSAADLNGVWGDEPTEIFHATRPPIPSFAPPQPPFNFRSSGRPLKSPPSVPQRPENAALEQLYAQPPSLVDEVMIALRTKNANSPPPDDPHNRPNKPPPPPPPKHATTHQKPTDKPSIPTKPISVKMLAARFDAKSAQVDL